MTSRRAVFALAALLSLAHFASFDVVRQPIVWDMRYYLYFAFRTAEGAVPYRDYFENKTPLSIFFGAALFRLGEALGVEPLHVIRIGCLAVGAGTGVLHFVILRRLAGRSGAAGLLGLLAYVGFPLIGSVCAVGVMPKALMAPAAAATALLVGRRRFLLAGVAGTLASLDWQVGGLAFLGAAAGALVERTGRRRALLAVAAGALACAALAVASCAATGSLDAAYRQTVATLFVRAAESAQESSADRLGILLANVGVACRGHVWLFALGIAGMILFPAWIARRRGKRTLGMAVALAVYHYGLAAFSLFDYQSYGDLFALLYSVSFFAGVSLVTLWSSLARTGLRGATPAALVVVALLARPSVLRPEIPLDVPTANPGATLDDQREVARQLAEEALGGKRIGYVGPAELMFLSRVENPLPFVYWNSVTYGHYKRKTFDEGYRHVWNRMLRTYRLDAVVRDRLDHGERIVASANGRYRVTVFDLNGEAWPTGAAPPP